MKKILYISIAILALAACNKQAPETGSNEISFSIGYPSTRATASEFESGDAVGIYAVEWQGDVQYPLQVGGNYINNERLSYDGTAWTASRALYWSSKPCDFYALYPYQSGIASVDKFPFSLALDQNGEGYETSDLLFAYAENVSKANGQVALNFKHIMSKLVVRVLKGEKFEGEIPDDIEAHVYNTTSSCFVDISKGSVAKDPFGAKNTLTMKKIDNQRFEAVIVPQNIEKRTPLIELTMGGIAYLLEYSLSFRPGYVHYVDLTLNTSPDQEMIEITIDPGINDWD